MALDKECQRLWNSALIRSRFSPVAMAILNGRVLDQLGAVKASLINSSITFDGTVLGKKSLVVLRDAKNSENSVALLIGFN